MILRVCPGVTYNKATKQYTIRRKKCRLDKTSPYGRCITQASISTQKKASATDLDDYSTDYGRIKPKKCKFINVNIEYGSVTDIGSAIKAFILSHYQTGSITLDSDYTNDDDTKVDAQLLAKSIKAFILFRDASIPPQTPLYTSSIASTYHALHSPSTSTASYSFNCSLPKRRKLSSSSSHAESSYHNNMESSNDETLTHTSPSTRGIMETIKYALQSIVVLYIQPLIQQAQQNNEMLVDISDKICPQTNRVNSRYRPFFHMDIVQLVNHFEDKQEEMIKRNSALERKSRKLKRRANGWKSKCQRRSKALGRFREYFQMKRIVSNLNVVVKHQRFRDKKIQDMVSSMQQMGVAPVESWEDFIFRHWDTIYRRKAEYRKRSIDKTWMDVVKGVNRKPVIYPYLLK